MKNPFEKRVEEEADLELAYRRALEALSRDAVQEKDFTDLYGEENVARDVAEVKRFESSPDFTEASKTATVLEAVIHEQSEMSDWLGPRAHTIKASRYDDIKHGVDEIVEFTEDAGKQSHLALGIDVTFNPNLTRKFERLISRLAKGQLTRLKYFRSGTMRGELTQIPEVVVGVDSKTLADLLPHWLARDFKTLSEHPAQILVLEEIRMQLEFFANYAAQANQPEAARKYQIDLQIIDGVLKEKEKLRKSISIEALKNDQVFYGIWLELERYKKRLSKEAKS